MDKKLWQKQNIELKKMRMEYMDKNVDNELNYG